MLMERRLVIISGLSGAGKTVALHALEDIGFYCIDNLPLGILLHFSDYLTQQPDGVLSKVAVVIDSRNCLLYTSPSPRDRSLSRMPSSA